MSNQDKTNVPLRHLMVNVFIEHNGPEVDILWTFVPLTEQLVSSLEGVIYQQYCGPCSGVWSPTETTKTGICRCALRAEEICVSL